MRAESTWTADRDRPRWPQWSIICVGLLLMGLTVGVWRVLHLHEARLLAAAPVAGAGTMRPAAPVPQPSSQGLPWLDEVILALGLTLSFLFPLLLSYIQSLHWTRALAELARRRCESLMDATGQLVWVADGAGEMISDLTSLAELTGLPAETLRRQAGLAAVHPADRAQLKQIWETACTAPHPIQVEYRLCTRAGEHRYYRTRAVPILNGAGQVREWVGLTADIHEFRQAQEALHETNTALAETNAQLAESEEHLRAIFNLASIGIVLTTIDGTILLANPRFSDIVGYGIDELHGMAAEDIIHPDDWTIDRDQYKRVLANEMDSYGRDIRHRCKDGSTVWVNQAISLIRDGAGTPLYVIAVVEDITARHQAEEALWQVHIELERRVEERTAELAEANAALAEANAQLRAEIIERERAQQALTANEERMRLGLAGTNVGLWDWHIPTNAITFVRHWAEILGYAPDQIEPGMAMWERCVHPEDRANAEELTRQHLAGQTPYCENEQRLRGPAGEWHWLLERGRVIAWDAKGNPVRMIGTYVDITERKQAQEALRVANGALAETNAQLARANDALEERVRERTTELAQVNDTLGQTNKALAEVNDQLRAEITERERAEETLRESEERYRALAESIPHIIWTANPDGRADFCNQYWCNYSGLSREEGIKGGWVATIHVDDVELALGSWQSALELNQGYSLELRVRRADGFYRWHRTQLTPVRNEQGEIVKWVGTAVDIHDRRQAEEALRQADQRKDEFLAMLAHELRNPLAPIRYAVHVLRQVGRNEQVLARQRDLIDRQVTHMARLLDDLLDVSRITSGKIHLVKQRLDLRQVVDQSLEVCRAALQARGHELFYSRSQAPLWLEGDVTRLEQVVGNLLNNAIKYTEPGGKIWLSVTAETLPATGAGANGEAAPWAFVRVRDTGVGIAPEMLGRVFELFAQADHSLDRAQGGLGIGLTLVRRLIELHGGQVEVCSKGLGHGSEFTIRLPLQPGVPVMPDPPQRPMEQPVRPAAAAPGLDGAQPTKLGVTTGRNGQFIPAQPASREYKVLVVDDNTDTARSMAELLELWGYQSAVALDGARALDLAALEKPDAVLLDVSLPGLSGHEVACRLRQTPGQEAVTLIALTGLGGEEERQRALESGFNHFFTKPVNLETLHQTLEYLSQLPPD